MTVKLIAARRLFADVELDRIRVIVQFYVSMRWATSYVIEPRLIVVEGIPLDAVPLIFDDLTAIVVTDAEMEWSEGAS